MAPDEQDASIAFLSAFQEEKRVYSVQEQVLGVLKGRKSVACGAIVVLTALDLCLRTIHDGENQSAIVIGPKGVGKKHVVRELIAQLPPVECVFLNGLTIASEASVFRQILVQLVPNGVFSSSSTASFQPMYTLLRQVLHEKALCGNTVLFLIDGLDAFTTNQKQLVLYNLLDWMQTSQVRIILLGITSTFTITQKLEKRVSSRFSNRLVVLSMPSFDEIQHHFLSETSDLRLIQLVREYYDAGKSLRWFYHIFSLSKPLNLTNFITTLEVLQPNVHFELMKSISSRELTVLIGMRRLEKKNHQVYSFEMVFEQLQQYYRAQGQQIGVKLSRTDALVAFQTLITLDLTRQVGNAFRLAGGNKNQLAPEYTVVQMMMDPIEFDSILPQLNNCSTHLKQWAVKP